MVLDRFIQHPMNSELTVVRLNTNESGNLASHTPSRLLSYCVCALGHRHNRKSPELWFKRFFMEFQLRLLISPFFFLLHGQEQESSLFWMNFLFPQHRQKGKWKIHVVKNCIFKLKNIEKKKVGHGDCNQTRKERREKVFSFQDDEEGERKKIILNFDHDRGWNI